MTTWVLLRGLTRETRHWGEFPRHLVQALPQARVQTVDLPGNGRLNTLASPTSVPGIVESVRAGLRERSVPLPCHLLAMSLGAMVAVDWASRYPHELAGGVLINTSLRPFSPMHHRLRPQNLPLLLRLLLGRADDRSWERAVLRLTSQQRADDAALLEEWIGWRHEHPVTRANALRQLMAAARYRAPPERPPVPVLVLGSAGDDLVDPRCSLELARRWALPIEMHPSAGHDLPLDDGPWVAARVRTWLQAATASASNSASI